MQLKNIQKEALPRKFWIFFIFYFLTILIIFITYGGTNWFFLLLLLTILSFFCFLVYWQIFILPDFGLKDHLTLSKYIILNQLFKTPYTYSVKDGEIIGDYGLLKIKPSIRLINVDQKSAVLLIDESKQRTFLFNGIHLLANNPKIAGTFSLGFRFIHIGPDNQYSLVKQNAQESLTDYHARIQLTGMTKTQLHSGAFIYPSFSVFYRLDIRNLGTNELNDFLSRTLLLNEISSSFISPKQFETFLINEILKDWRNFCNSNDDEKIFAEYPGKFESLKEKIKGVLLQIYIDKILR
jgi:hypothetical protein